MTTNTLPKFIAGVAIGVAAAVVPLAATADVLVVDENTSGTLYDGVIDGFPGLATFDGVADLAGNSLAIALQDGVTEERAIIEFPLASLAGVDPLDVVSATLTFNIDDVITTFGPGTSFDGTAAETIVLFDYVGNGSIDLTDYENVAGAPLSVVSTVALGPITDASLALSGPLAFDVDVTVALAAHLSSSDTHMGIVIATSDDLSATSLDDLGDGAVGPPGVGGSFMPLLTIVTATGEPPVYSKAELKCQKAMGKESGKFLKTAQKELTKCMDAVLASASKGADPAANTDKCAAGIDPSSVDSKISRARVKAAAKIASSCAGLVPPVVGSPCDALAVDFGETAVCVLDDHTTQLEEALRSTYAAGCDLLGAVGRDGDYPTLCASE